LIINKEGLNVKDSILQNNSKDEREYALHESTFFCFYKVGLVIGDYMYHEDHSLRK